MAEKARDSSEQLDVQKIHYLVRLMKRYDLTDLNINDGHVQIRLKRRGPEIGRGSHGLLARDALGRNALRDPCRLLLPPRRLALDLRPPRNDRAAPCDRHQEPHGRHLLRLERTGRRSLCDGRLRGPARDHRLYHRGHESLHGYSRGGHRRRSPRSWSRTDRQSNLISPCFASIPA